jgi:hypothetical protein
MPCPFHPPRRHYSNHTWWTVQIMKLLITQCFSNLLSLHLSSVQIFSSAPCSFCIQLVVSLQIQVTHSVRIDHKFKYSIILPCPSYNSNISNTWVGPWVIKTWIKSVINDVLLDTPQKTLGQWFSNCEAWPPGGAQHIFLQIKIKLRSPKQAHPSHWTSTFKCLIFFEEKN